MFVDEVRIYVKAGDGGNGCSSFRREKFVPKGGPDGGDGGDGGDIILIGDGSINSLNKIRGRQHYRAERGEHGKGKDMHGRNGKPCIIYVPAGTVVKDAETGEILADINEDKKEVVLLKGGSGGKGNARFATSINRAPRYCEKGEEKEEIRIKLELKIIADISIVGYPNAGKSTLISSISSAKPKIADYKFTTLNPNVGIVEYGDFRSFVIADIPGLIEGASEGRGLGIKFLRHIERTRVILHLIDGATPEKTFLEDLFDIRNEIRQYNPDMLDRQFAVALNKIDALFSEEMKDEIQSYCRKQNIPYFEISAVTHKNLKELKDALGKMTEHSGEQVVFFQEKPVVISEKIDLMDEI